MWKLKFWETCWKLFFKLFIWLHWVSLELASSSRLPDLHGGLLKAVWGLGCSVACGILVPWPWSEPELQGIFLTTGPPGKSLGILTKVLLRSVPHYQAAFPPVELCLPACPQTTLCSRSSQGLRGSFSLVRFYVSSGSGEIMVKREGRKKRSSKEEWGTFEKQGRRPKMWTAENGKCVS